VPQPAYGFPQAPEAVIDTANTIFDVCIVSVIAFELNAFQAVNYTGQAFFSNTGSFFDTPYPFAYSAVAADKIEAALDIFYSLFDLAYAFLYFIKYIRLFTFAFTAAVIISVSKHIVITFKIFALRQI
jgi:hypothetical protein